MNHTRHLDIYNIPSFWNVGIVGAGGIGAITALTLVKMGVKYLTVWDDDVVSEENLSTQLHRVSDVGNLKLLGLEQTLKTYSDDIDIIAIDERVEADYIFTDRYDLFIMAVDSITARQNIFRALTRDGVVRAEWVLDMRMASEQYQHYLFQPGTTQANVYGAGLMSMREEDVPEVPCTQKATFYTATAAAFHAGTVVRNIVTENVKPQRLVHLIPQQQIMTFNI